MQFFCPACVRGSRSIPCVTCARSHSTGPSPTVEFNAREAPLNCSAAAAMATCASLAPRRLAIAADRCPLLTLAQPESADTMTIRSGAARPAVLLTGDRP